jgi:uncharacterized protein
MSNNMFESNYNQGFSGATQDVTGTGTRTFLANVFAYMFAALAISGFVAYFIGANPARFMSMFVSASGGISPLFWVVTFAPFGLVLLMSFAFNKLSSMAMLAVYLLYSVLMGMSLSSVFIVYEMGSIANVFFITAGTFGAMAVLGYTTKTDLTKFGSILMMALIGLIIASIVNFFMQSDSMSWLISVIGVLIFTGLTAYDVQKLKNMGAQVGTGNELASKTAIMGGLTLYLDFINLFLFLLRLFGNRN